MDYKEAERVVFGQNEDKSSANRDDMYQTELNRLQNMIASAPESLKPNHQIKLDRLKTAYQTLLTGPTGIGLIPPKGTIVAPESNEKNESEDASTYTKESRPTFLKALMSHWGIFFLTLGSLCAALLMTIMWSGQRTELAKMDELRTKNDLYRELLTNKPMKLINAESYDLELFGYEAFAFDDENMKFKKFKKNGFSKQFQMKAGNAAKSLKDDLSDFNGDALFYSLVIGKIGTDSVKVISDYVGNHQNENGSIIVEFNK